MKYVKNLFVLICLMLIVVPSMVSAKNKEKIKVYIFHGDGCPHCAKALEFFDSIKDEYGDYYELVKYETWTSLFSASNSELMKSVATEFGEDLSSLGVPYIIIGDKTFLGYTESYGEEIKKTIVEAYNSDSYEDKVAPIIKKKRNVLLTDVSIASGFSFLAIILVIINFALRKKFAKNN